MGFRFRKSVKIAPGVRMNFGKKGVGMSFGGKGARYSISSTGRRTTTVGIPGTGLSYSTSSGGRRRKSSGGGVKVLYWLFIGWWWWPVRLLCYDLPKFIIKKIIAIIKEKPEA